MRLKNIELAAVAAALAAGALPPGPPGAVLLSSITVALAGGGLATAALPVLGVVGIIGGAAFATKHFTNRKSRNI